MKSRHELLSGAIGTFAEEDEAYLLVTWLLWVIPLTVTLAAAAAAGDSSSCSRSGDDT